MVLLQNTFLKQNHYNICLTYTKKEIRTYRSSCLCIISAFSALFIGIPTVSHSLTIPVITDIVLSAVDSMEIRFTDFWRDIKQMDLADYFFVGKSYQKFPEIILHVFIVLLQSPKLIRQFCFLR